MNLSVTDRFKVQDAAELYGLDGWGDGYLEIAPDGHLLVRPDAATEHGIDLYEVVSELREREIRTPVLLRFPQLLVGQLERLARAFASAIGEYGYSGSYAPLFPIKVNQQRAVLDALLAGGQHFGLGLEVGSRPELMVAAALPTPPQALIVCNGFKDDGVSALPQRWPSALGKRVVVVLEKPFELEPFLELARRAEPVHAPDRLPTAPASPRVRAVGEVGRSCTSKFGMTTRQLLAQSSSGSRRPASLDQVALSCTSTSAARSPRSARSRPPYSRPAGSTPRCARWV